MKILIASSYLPYPLYSGGQVRLYNLIKELSSKHEITLVCEIRPNQTAEDIESVAAICKEVITVPRRKQWSVKNIIKAATSKSSFLVTGHTLSEMKEKITVCLEKNEYDLIHVETYYVMQNVPQTSVPIVLVEHNIEYKVYERFKERMPIMLQSFLSIDIAKIKREEENAWKKAKRVVAVSKDDQKAIELAGVSAELVSNGVNTEQFSFKQKKESSDQKILFIGDFKWVQNKDSATYIIKEIWPQLKAKTGNKNIKLWIVARNIPDSIKNLTHDPDVLFDEQSSAKDTPEIFQEATVLLAPIRVGGGTSYKILESMSCGTPVITMPLSAQALGAEDSKELLVGSSADELAQKTTNVLQDNSLHQQISKTGRAFIENNYTWKEIAEDLNAVYKSVTK
jgi:polysaccharide biosynthesis protein PslH